MRRFFGKGVLNDGFALVYGTIIDSRLMTPNPEQFRFAKTFRDGRIIKLTGPSGNMMGDCEIRAASYLVNTIGPHRKNPITVIDDQSSLKDLNRTFVSFGSPSSNEISELVIREPANLYLEFGQDQDGGFIRDKRTTQKFYGFKGPIKKDYGMILKIPNQRFPGHYFFVCAGLGEWGTSGATWYIAQKWNELPKNKNGFGIIVEIELNSDSSARQIFPENVS